MNAENRILELFSQNPERTPNELFQEIGVSKQTIHKVLKKLTENHQIERFGSPPKTFYRKINDVKNEVEKSEFSVAEQDFLKKNFLVISENGQYLEGAEGFENWCRKRNLPPQKTFAEFVKTREKYDGFVAENGLLDGTEKLRTTKGFDEVYLDKLYYLDFYAIERFGKTKLGTILHYAKQGQNKFLMNILLSEISAKIKAWVEEEKFDAVAFVPPTIRREVQLMKFLEDRLKISLPKINIIKTSGLIPVPQKSLNKLEERINNASSTFTVAGNAAFRKVLLIDDAVGSGATINQIAKKIRDRNLADTIYGLALVGSFKGFEVINDV